MFYHDASSMADVYSQSASYSHTGWIQLGCICMQTTGMAASNIIQSCMMQWLLQAEFKQQYQDLPTVLTTSAQHNVGRSELLAHIARLRNLNASAPEPGAVEPDEWEGLAD